MGQGNEDIYAKRGGPALSEGPQPGLPPPGGLSASAPSCRGELMAACSPPEGSQWLLPSCPPPNTLHLPYGSLWPGLDPFLLGGTEAGWGAQEHPQRGLPVEPRSRVCTPCRMFPSAPGHVTGSLGHYFPRNP